MVDSRLGFTDLDRQLLEFIAPRLANGAVKLLVLLTKSDKLNRRDADAALAAAQLVLGDIATQESDLAMSLFSALKKSGVGDAALVLHQWVRGAAVDGAAA
jgi:GTP-binding protein